MCAFVCILGENKSKRYGLYYRVKRMESLLKGGTNHKILRKAHYEQFLKISYWQASK